MQNIEIGDWVSHNNLRSVTVEVIGKGLGPSAKTFVLAAFNSPEFLEHVGGTILDEDELKSWNITNKVYVGRLVWRTAAVTFVRHAGKQNVRTVCNICDVIRGASHVR